MSDRPNTPAEQEALKRGLDAALRESLSSGEFVRSGRPSGAVSGPKLCVVTEEPCLDAPPCSLSDRRWTCPGCNGDGTRSVHTPAPDGSLLLDAEQADACRLAVAYVLTAGFSDDAAIVIEIAPALDALGVER